MKFNIVITDTETGETVLNENTNCIIGAISKGDGKAKGMCIVAANAIDAAATIGASREAGLKCCEHNPTIALAYLVGNGTEEKDGAENE